MVVKKNKCNGVINITVLLAAAQQRMPGILASNKLVQTNAVLSRSYNVVPSTAAQTVSATQIAKKLLHTEGIQGLYKGLGATLMRLAHVY